MRKLVVVLLALVFLAGTVDCFAQKAKGASKRAQERASDEAVFHRVGDWFATVGKSKEEKEKIVQERKAQRAVKRAEKEAEKARKKAEKEARKKAKEAEKAKEEMKRSGKKTKTKTKKGWKKKGSGY